MATQGLPKRAIRATFCPLLGRVAKWQTRRIQNPLPERECRFKSGLGYSENPDVFRTNVRSHVGGGLDGIRSASMRVSVGLVLFVLSFGSAAHAQSARVSVDLSEPPEGCIDSAKLAAGVAVTLRHHVDVGSEASDTARVMLSWGRGAADEHQLTIRVSAFDLISERMLETDGPCDRLDEAAIVVTSLLVDDALRSLGSRAADEALRIETPSSRWTLGARALATLSFGSWPGLAWGSGLDIEIGAFLDPSWSFAVLAGFGAIPPYETQVGVVRAELVGFSGRLAMGIRFEAHPVLRLSAMLGGRLGWMQGEGRAIDASRVANRSDGIVDLEVAIRWAFAGPLGLRLAGGPMVVIPPLLIRYRDDSGALVAAHEGGLIAGHVSLAIDLELSTP